MDAGAIIRSAVEQAGHDRFAHDSYREGLDIFTKGLRGREGFHGHDMVAAMIAGGLANRLQVDDYLRAHPELLDRPVTAPLIVMGMPRTGTTVISYLLGADSGLRSLINWEANASVPPPRPGTFSSDPRYHALVAQHEATLAHNPDAFSIHYEAPDGPTECVFVQAQDVRSCWLEAVQANPAYSEWILGCDMRPAYEHHKRVLQTLQHHVGGRWNLKAPSHALHIRALRQVYPDAKMVWTHRNPFDVTTSLFSAISGAHRAFGTVDLDFIRKTYVHQLREHVMRPIALIDELGEDPFHHIFYDDVMRDPMAEIRKLYAWLGYPLTPEAEAAMRQWQRDNPQHRHGKHKHQLSDFGVTKEDLYPAYADYIARFPQVLPGGMA